MDESLKSKEELSEIATRLSEGQLGSCRIQKQEVTAFGEVIRNRSDFLHFRGNAQKGGDVIYTYLQDPRS